MRSSSCPLLISSLFWWTSSSTFPLITCSLLNFRKRTWPTHIMQSYSQEKGCIMKPKRYFLHQILSDLLFKSTLTNSETEWCQITASKNMLMNCLSTVKAKTLKNLKSLKYRKPSSGNYLTGLKSKSFTWDKSPNPNQHTAIMTILWTSFTKKYSPNFITKTILLPL